MIKYKLKCKSTYCTEQNEFDGWFQNIEAFEKQMSLGLINCPICGSHNIIKLLATPNVRKAKSQTTKNTKIANDTLVTNSEKSVLGNENLKKCYNYLKDYKKRNTKELYFCWR